MVLSGQNKSGLAGYCWREHENGRKRGIRTSDAIWELAGGRNRRPYEPCPIAHRSPLVPHVQLNTFRGWILQLHRGSVMSFPRPASISGHRHEVFDGRVSLVGTWRDREHEGVAEIAGRAVEVETAVGGDHGAVVLDEGEVVEVGRGGMDDGLPPNPVTPAVGRVKGVVEAIAPLHHTAGVCSQVCSKVGGTFVSHNATRASRVTGTSQQEQKNHEMGDTTRDDSQAES